MTKAHYFGTDFIVSIIDVFEGFLEEKGVVINNPEKDDLGPDEDPAQIYGSDYFSLEDNIRALCSAEKTALADSILSSLFKKKTIKENKK